MHNYSLSFEILCATMHQTDFSKIKSMNIHSDVVFANQTDCNSFDEIQFDGHVAKMITTKTRGVGLNRNIALLASSRDILLFADDDTVFADDLEENVVAAFEKFPKADMICFGMNFSKLGKIYYTRNVKTGKLPFYKSLKYGTAVIAVRRKSYLKANLSFSQLFGGGCPYLHGEDSDFILSSYRKGLKVYTYDYVLGCTAKDVSTCNFGYNEKYFFDTGALAKYAFGSLAIPYMLYMAFRINQDCNVSFFKKISLLFRGYNSFNHLSTFVE